MLVEPFGATRGTEQVLAHLCTAYDELRIEDTSSDMLDVTPSLGTILVIREFEKTWPRTVQIQKEMAPLFDAMNAMIKKPKDITVVGMGTTPELMGDNPDGPAA